MDTRTPFKEHTFTHPILGPLTGRISQDTPSTIHFRSIPFATIPARFRQSILLSHIPPTTSRNFTTYGTACPSPPENEQTEGAGGPLPGEEPKEFDEFSCLNLTISAPVAGLGGDGKRGGVPVMVYVHGGAFVGGSAHVSALNDTTRMVELSIKDRNPVVIVSIHYRTNWFGFLACQDLVNEANSLNEPSSNFGLHDQRTAFHWIHRFIAGFGGNLKNITAFGESAGSGSIALHMCSSLPLFNRAILMSGVPSTIPPAELKYKEAEYQALLKYLGIESDDPERLEKLRNVSSQKLVEAVRGVGLPFFTVYRNVGFFDRGFPTYFSEERLIGECEWVNEVMIGDGYFEGANFANLFMSISPDRFITHSNIKLGPESASSILSAYGITPSMDANLFTAQLTYLTGDIMFSQPIHKLSQGLASGKYSPKKRIFRYTTTVRNQFFGSSLYQIPGHHFVDLLFMFGTLRERYPSERLRKLSEEWARRWMRFGAGVEPWGEYVVDGDGEEKIMVINGGEEGWDLRNRKIDEESSASSEEGERRYREWEVIDAVIGKILNKKGEVKAEEAMLEWGTDGGIFKLAGMNGPFGEVVP